MAAVTTFLIGAVVGGGAKWAYDKWQEKDDKPDLSVKNMREKSAAGVRRAGQKVSSVVRRDSKADVEVVEPEETNNEASDS